MFFPNSTWSNTIALKNKIRPFMPSYNIAGMISKHRVLVARIWAGQNPINTGLFSLICYKRWISLRYHCRDWQEGRMALLSERLTGLAPSHGRSDVPPRCMLPLEVVVPEVQLSCANIKKKFFSRRVHGRWNKFSSTVVGTPSLPIL